MKKTKTILFIIISLIILAILILPKLNLSSDDVPGSVNNASEMKTPVDIYVIKSRVLQDKIIATGTILADEEVELKSEASGKISKILFKEGSRVNKGELLVKINDAELQAQLLKAEFSVKLAEQKEYRQKRMLEKQAISQEEYDISLNELNTLKAEIQLIKAQIEKTEIKAPFSGIIGLKSVSEGSYISPAAAIARLQSINPIKIDFSVPEKYYNIIKQGTDIRFKMQGNNKSFTGKIYAIEPKIDPATRTLQIRALSRNDKEEIYPGSFTEIEIILDEIQNAVMIPTEAVIPDLKSSKVFVVKNGLAVSVEIETGLRKEREIQIIKGLQPGDTVVIAGIMQLRPGVPVSIAN